MKELEKLIQAMGLSVEEFKAQYGKEFEAMKRQVDAIETAVARGQFPGGGTSSPKTRAAAQEHEKAFLNWMRKGSNDAELRDLEIRAELSTVSDPDGGFLVPEQMDESIDKLAVDTVAMRRIARVKGNLAGDYKRLLSTGGATGAWVGEREDRDETDTPALHEFAPPWSEWYALPEVTQALLDNSAFDVEAWLLDELLDVETTMEGTAFISGNGVKQPKGILSYNMIANASWEYGKVGYIASGHASLLNNADKLIDFQHSLKPAYRRNGRFLMNDATWNVIRKFKDGEGNYLWRPGLAENAPDILLGKPVEIDDNMDDIGAGKYPLAFADWQRAYMIGDHRAGRRLIRDPYTKKGWVKFYVSKRVFGGIINFQAIKLLKIATA